MSQFAIGMILGLSGSIGINTGQNMQALGMARLEQAEAKERPDGPEEDYVLEKAKPVDARKSKLWIAGTVVFVLSHLCNFAAFGFAPQSLLASLEVSQFVSNLCFGRLFLKKKITREMCLGTLCVVAAVVLIVVYSEQSEVYWTVDQLQNNFLRLPYIIFVSFGVLTAPVLFVLTRRFRVKNLAKTTLTTKNTLASVRLHQKGFSGVGEVVCFSVLTAYFGCQAVVNSKILACILTSSGGEAFTEWFFYLCLCLWIFWTIIFLFRMNDGLRKYNTLFLIPVLQSNYILLGIISGGCFFDEFATFEQINWGMFALGIVLLMLGLYFLRPRSEDDDDANSDQLRPRDQLRSSIEMAPSSASQGAKNVKNC